MSLRRVRVGARSRSRRHRVLTTWFMDHLEGGLRGANRSRRLSSARSARAADAGKLARHRLPRCRTPTCDCGSVRSRRQASQDLVNASAVPHRPRAPTRKRAPVRPPRWIGVPRKGRITWGRCAIRPAAGRAWRSARLLPSRVQPASRRRNRTWRSISPRRICSIAMEPPTAGTAITAGGRTARLMPRRPRALSTRRAFRIPPAIRPVAPARMRQHDGRKSDRGPRLPRSRR